MVPVGDTPNDGDFSSLFGSSEKEENVSLPYSGKAKSDASGIEVSKIVEESPDPNLRVVFLELTSVNATYRYGAEITSTEESQELSLFLLYTVSCDKDSTS